MDYNKVKELYTSFCITAGLFFNYTVAPSRETKFELVNNKVLASQ